MRVGSSKSEKSKDSVNHDCEDHVKAEVEVSEVHYKQKKTDHGYQSLASCIAHHSKKP